MVVLAGKSELCCSSCTTTGTQQFGGQRQQCLTLAVQVTSLVWKSWLGCHTTVTATRIMISLVTRSWWWCHSYTMILRHPSQLPGARARRGPGSLSAQPETPVTVGSHAIGPGQAHRKHRHWQHWSHGDSPTGPDTGTGCLPVTESRSAIVRRAGDSDAAPRVARVWAGTCQSRALSRPLPAQWMEHGCGANLRTARLRSKYSESAASTVHCFVIPTRGNFIQNSTHQTCRNATKLKNAGDLRDLQIEL